MNAYYVFPMRRENSSSSSDDSQLLLGDDGGRRIHASTDARRRRLHRTSSVDDLALLAAARRRAAGRRSEFLPVGRRGQQHELRGSQHNTDHNHARQHSDGATPTSSPPTASPAAAALFLRELRWSSLHNDDGIVVSSSSSSTAEAEAHDDDGGKRGGGSRSHSRRGRQQRRHRKQQQLTAEAQIQRDIRKQERIRREMETLIQHSTELMAARIDSSCHHHIGAILSMRRIIKYEALKRQAAGTIEQLQKLASKVQRQEQVGEGDDPDCYNAELATILAVGDAPLSRPLRSVEDAAKIMEQAKKRVEDLQQQENVSRAA